MVHIALLRAVNVGGTGKLPMAELRALCANVGLTQVRTYIASGNVVCESPLAPAAVKAKLEKALHAKLGKPCAVMVRSLAEMEAVEKKNPFPGAPPGFLLVIFLDQAPPKDALKAVKVPGGEQFKVVGRELFIHYPEGMGKSRLRTPLADVGTGRNLNTVRALIAMAKGDA